MFKKIMACVVLLVITALSMRTLLYNEQVDAADGDKYYGPGDVFAETGRSSFRIGNIDWYIAYADQTSGKGIILGLPAMKSLVDLSTFFSRYDLNYKDGLLNNGGCGGDKMGEKIYAMNQDALGSLKLLTIDQYNLITNNESDFTAFNFNGYWANIAEFWMEGYYEGNTKPIFYVYDSNTAFVWGGAKTLYPGYTHIVYNANNNNPASYIVSAAEINLPKKFPEPIEAIQADQVSIVKKYPDHTVDTINITTEKGDGPFHFYIYDTDVNGVGNSSQASAYFRLDHVDTMNGTAQVNQINALPYGDYYFKVKVVDESTANNLYSDPTDITKDPNRVKETDVIHVQIKKGVQDPLQVYGSASDRDQGVNDQTSFSLEKTEASITLFPKGGSSLIADSEITYTIENDPNHILGNTPGKGASATFTLSHAVGSATVKITKPGGTNYDDVSTTVTITVTSIADTPSITATTGGSAYGSGDKVNQDVIVTFNKGPNGGSVTNALKLKTLSGNLNPPTDWYKTSGTLSSITPGDMKTTPASNQHRYICYWLYYDGYLEDGVEFRVDTWRDAPKLQNYSATAQNQITNNSKVLLAVPSDQSGWNRYTATISDASGTKVYNEEPLTIGTYTIDVQDEYGNTAQYQFDVVPASANAPQLPNNGSGYYKIDGTKGKDNWYVSNVKITPTGKDGYDEISSDGVTFQTNLMYQNDGSHTVDFYLRNSTTGVVAKAIRIQLKIDQTAPDVPVLSMQVINKNAFARFINALSFGNWMNQGAKVTMTSRDATSGLDHFEYIEISNGTTVNKTSSTGIVTYQKDSEITLQAKACDKAGNCSVMSASEDLMIDLKAPSINGVKDQSTYKYYYLPRFVSITDTGSGLSYAEYKKDGVLAGNIQENVNEKINGIGQYEIYAIDHAGNEVRIQFQIIPLPDIDDIDGSDESKDIIDQVQEELDDIKDKIDQTEKDEYEQWIEDALEKWESSRKKVVETDDKSAKVEGQGDTSFDPKVELIVDEISENDVPRLPKKALAVYDVYLQKGNVKVQPDGSIKVYLPYSGQEDPIVYEIDGNQVKELHVTREGNFVTFVSDSLVKYAISNTAQKDNEDFNDKTCKLEGKEINVDTDGDGLPDLNLDIDHDCIADLNIDTDFDRIPNINIDTKGDGKADINIDKNGDGKADLNIAIVDRWVPNKDCKYNDFSYDTAEGFIPILNVDDDGDGEPDRNIDDNGDGIPDRNIDPDWFDRYGKPNSNTNIGGAFTGDTTKWVIWWILLVVTGATMGYSQYQKRKHRS